MIAILEVFMNEYVIIALIIALVIVAIAYRDRVSSIFFKKDENGTQVGFDAEKKKSGFFNNLFVGSKHKVKITEDTNAQNNTMIGNTEFSVQTSKKPKKG